MDLPLRISIIKLGSLGAKRGAKQGRKWGQGGCVEGTRTFDTLGIGVFEKREEMKGLVQNPRKKKGGENELGGETWEMEMSETQNDGRDD